MFATAEAAKNQLQRDKHTVLEGYVSEYLFEQRFLKGKTAYSKGWWIVPYGKDGYIAFCYSKAFRNIENEVEAVLTTGGIDVWFVTFNNGKFFFQGRNEKHLLSIEEIVNKYNLSDKREVITATSSTRNVSRQNECMTFFQQLNMLYEIAEQRFFANDILSRYFDSVINVDFFARNKREQLCLVEVKFKYPAKDNTFGFDIGLGNTFDYVAKKCCIPLYHFILLKTDKNEKTSIFDYLKNNPNNHTWLFAELHDLSAYKIKYAPLKTSLDGKRHQAYYAIDESNFVKCPIKG